MTLLPRSGAVSSGKRSSHQISLHLTHTWLLHQASHCSLQQGAATALQGLQVMLQMFPKACLHAMPVPAASLCMVVVPINSTCCEHETYPIFVLAAATTSSSVQFQTNGNNTPTAAILNGVGAQATFQNTAGQVVVVTSNTPGTVTIPIASDGEPSVPSGSDLTVVSNDPSIPSTSSSSSPGREECHFCIIAVFVCSLLQCSTACMLSCRHQLHWLTCSML